MAKNVYEMITERVIEQLEKGVAPWRKPWAILKNADERRGDPNTAYRWSNGRAYGYINQMLLPEGGYITYNQVKANGGKIRKGAKSQLIFEYFHSDKRVERVKDEATGVESEIVWSAHWSLRYYPAFHVDDIEGLPVKDYANVTSDDDLEMPTDFEAQQEDANRCLDEYIRREGIVFHQGSNEAYYSPSHDAICVPAKKQYKSMAEYFSTTFHEVTHSTGHRNRLARKGITDCEGFGKDSYAQEELVAEMGSVMMLSHLGIDSTDCFENSASYLKGWVKRFKDDAKMIVIAAQQAENAVEFILTGKSKKTQGAA